MHEYSWLQHLRYYLQLSLLYGVTVLAGWMLMHPVHSLSATQRAALTRGDQRPYVPTARRVPIISGKPVRITIPDSGVDLPVDEGYYDADTDEWTLSGYHAQFAMMSSLANDTSGETFIYGHNNNDVFGALRHNTPVVGAEAFLYADNGHVFAYKFVSVTSVGPNDAEVLSYQGPSQMTIQTCTGSLNEWRTMYRFDFEKVVQ